MFYNYPVNSFMKSVIHNVGPRPIQNVSKAVDIFCRKLIAFLKFHNLQKSKLCNDFEQCALQDKNKMRILQMDRSLERGGVFFPKN